MLRTPWFLHKFNLCLKKCQCMHQQRKNYIKEGVFLNLQTALAHLLLSLLVE